MNNKRNDEMSETETDDEDLSAPPQQRTSTMQSRVSTEVDNDETTDDLEEISPEEYRTSVKRKRDSLSPVVTEPATKKQLSRKPIEGIVIVFLLTQV